MSKSIIKQKRILTKAAGGSSLATPVSVANGGTGISSYAIGDIIYASGATTLSTLADVATGNALISGGVGTAPSWGKIGLTTHITGGNWKTIYTNGSGVVTELALGSSGQVLQSNGASSAPTWVTPSSGITVGTTTITSGTTTNIPFNLAGVYQEANSANFDYLQFIAQTGSAGSKVRIGPSIYINTPVNGTGGVIIGDSKAMAFGDYRYVLGRGCMDGSNSIGIGHNSGSNGTLNNSIVIGSSSVQNIYPARSAVIAIGHSITGLQAGNIGYWGSATYWNDVIYFNDATASTAKSIILSACGGSGSNNVAANLNLYAGLSTGSGTPATIGLYSSAAGASSSTAQTAVKVLEITNSTTITTSDAVNYALGSTTGTKWGTATTQKIGFWGVTPVTQYATTGTTTGFTANASANTLFNESTFTGDTGATAYTISDLVKALKLCGIILA